MIVMMKCMGADMHTQTLKCSFPAPQILLLDSRVASCDFLLKTIFIYLILDLRTYFKPTCFLIGCLSQKISAAGGWYQGRYDHPPLENEERNNRSAQGWTVFELSVHDSELASSLVKLL